MPFPTRLALVLAACLAPAPSRSAEGPPTHREPGFSDRMGFELEENGHPAGWGTQDSSAVRVDGEHPHGGRLAARIRRTSADGFTSLAARVPVDFAGRMITLSGYIRTEDVSRRAALWVRLDGHAGVIQLDNMWNTSPSGTTDWTRYDVSVALTPEGREVVFGALLDGPGTMWVDDLSLVVDGAPLAGTEIVEPEPTVLELDTAFDEGSGLRIDALGAGEVADLDLLCRVWGFLKYHHPAVAAGEHHWDYALFRAIPRVLAASDRASARAAILDWARGTLGPTSACEPCASPPGNVVLAPDLAWLEDQATLGEDLHAYLANVYANRHASESSFYVRLSRGARHPLFEHEAAYARLEAVDVGFRLLALFRYWNIIQYWFPYRDVIGSDWNAILPAFIPRFVAATDRDAYRLTLHALIARVNDTHANLWSNVGARPPEGDCTLPVATRFLEEEAVVTAVLDSTLGLSVGDVIEAIDGTTVSQLIVDWSPYYGASNAAARLRDIARSLTDGPCGPCTLTVRHGDRGTTQVRAIRVRDVDRRRWHDRPGPAFQRLSEEIAYLKLSAVTQDSAASYVERAASASGLVIDIRSYPAAFMVFALGRHLHDEKRPFARFTRADVPNPGAFSWTEPVSIQPAPPRFAGRLAILVDEVSQSQAEYTTMAFRAVPGAVVVGSTTAGADGNASWFPLPGGERSMISGIGVFYPDGSPTQRIGIVPDVEARPTRRGLREGRDEVLEAALRHLLGAGAPEARVRELARRP